MYIINTINNQDYPTSEMIFERKYVPCICKIKPRYFEISFTISRLENLKLEVLDFDIDKLGLYSLIGVGGTWWIHDEALITLRKNSDNPNRLEFMDLAFFDLFAGWFWAIKDGKWTSDYVGKDEEEMANAKIYALQE